jgi:hypothetical protein
MIADTQYSRASPTAVCLVHLQARFQGDVSTWGRGDGGGGSEDGGSGGSLSSGLSPREGTARLGVPWDLETGKQVVHYIMYQTPVTDLKGPSSTQHPRPCDQRKGPGCWCSRHAGAHCR